MYNKKPDVKENTADTMKLSEDYTAGSHIIQSYDDDHIVVNSKCFSKSFLVSNTSLNENWGINDIGQMTHEHWHDIIKLQPEVILMGTGKKLVFPHPSTYAPAIEKGIGVEFMDSRAACRTYNILLSEDRFIIAGIIL